MGRHKERCWSWSSYVAQAKARWCDLHSALLLSTKPPWFSKVSFPPPHVFAGQLWILSAHGYEHWASIQGGKKIIPFWLTSYFCLLHHHCLIIANDYWGKLKERQEWNLQLDKRGVKSLITQAGVQLWYSVWLCIQLGLCARLRVLLDGSLALTGSVWGAGDQAGIL